MKEDVKMLFISVDTKFTTQHLIVNRKFPHVKLIFVCLCINHKKNVVLWNFDDFLRSSIYGMNFKTIFDYWTIKSLFKMSKLIIEFLKAWRILHLITNKIIEIYFNTKFFFQNKILN